MGPFTCLMYYARLHQFFFLIRIRLAQNTSFFMSLSAAMGNSFFHDGWNFRIPPSSYFLTFSLSCFCSQGDSGFLLLPIFHRSSKLATTVHNGSETRQSDLIKYLPRFSGELSSAFKMRGDYLFKKIHFRKVLLCL